MRIIEVPIKQLLSLHIVSHWFVLNGAKKTNAGQKIDVLEYLEVSYHLIKQNRDVYLVLTNENSTIYEADEKLIS